MSVRAGTRLSVFPLAGAILFPRMQLPLHIFEPRYRQMVRDALAGSGLIGMVLLRGDWERDYYGAPDVYRVGCAGRIVESTPLPDGKFNIVLAGLTEFEIVSEQRERLYRQATVSWREPSEVELPGDLRAELVAMIERYVGHAGDDETRTLLGDVSLDDRTLVNFFSFWLDLTTIERQSLLEEHGAARARRLLEILEFRLYARRNGDVDVAMRRVH
jgi:Lon protease-like protein